MRKPRLQPARRSRACKLNASPIGSRESVLALLLGMTAAVGAGTSPAPAPPGASALHETVRRTAMLAGAPATPTAALYGPRSTASASFDVFITFSEEIAGLTDDDFVITNGIASNTINTSADLHDTHQTPLRGRYYRTTISADRPGPVTVALPAGAVTSATGKQTPSLASNTMVTDSAFSAGEFWIIDDADSWRKATFSSRNMDIRGGFAEPSAESGSFTSTTKTFSQRTRATSLTFRQSTAWDNWTRVPNVGPPDAKDAPVFLPVANDDYYFLGKGPTHAYYAWHSTDMENWTGPSRVTLDSPGWDKGRMTTSAEYKNGTFYILYDSPNDQDPALFTDTDLMDNIVGTDHGIVFDDPSNGSDSSLFRDNADGLFHIIYEEWSPINAQENSWDSPLAGHTSSPDAINGFAPHKHQPAVDLRTSPTGTFGSYYHHTLRHWPDKFDYAFEVHTPAQDSFGDWTTIKIGPQYYLFGDYDQHDGGMKVACFTSDSI